MPRILGNAYTGTQLLLAKSQLSVARDPVVLELRGTDAMAATSHGVSSQAGVVPRVNVRVVLFTILDGQLSVVLENQAGLARLPGSDLVADLALDVAAIHVLADRIGIEERYIEQLYTLSQRVDGDWTVTVAYLGLALAEGISLLPGDAAWYDVADLPEMPSLDRRIVDYALVRLRAKLGYTTIAFHLLPLSFSLSELQQVYESVLDQQLDKRNFRRRIQSAGILAETSETRREGSHRPARLFRFRAAHDADAYLTPAWATSPDRESPAT